MLKNVRRNCMRVVSAVMAMALTVSAIPMQAYAEEIIPEDVYLTENVMPEDILGSDVFYITSSSAQLSEGANERYYVRIGRGGDEFSAASVNVKIADLTAKYGEDYEVYLFNDDEEVDNPSDNKSLMEAIEGEGYTVNSIASDEEIIEMLENNEELGNEIQDAVDDSVDYIANEAGITDETATEAATEEVTETEAASEETDESSENLVPAEKADGSEVIDVDPLQQARATYTGIEGEAQSLTATADTYAQIQEIADLLTSTIVGANLKVDFEEGEESKYIVIDVKNNLKSDGDRYFYFMLSDPAGSTTVSAASSCAFTIVDDEEKINSEVSFSGYTFNESYDTMTVEMKRTGSLNSLAEVQLVSEGITAQMGRDFSPVDSKIVFPMGIDTRTIDIPVCTDYLLTDAEFKLKLTAVNNADVVTPEQICVLSVADAAAAYAQTNGLTNTFPETAEYMANENSKGTLGYVNTSNSISLKDYIKDKGQLYRASDKTYNDMLGSYWQMFWREGSWTWTDDDGAACAEWNLIESKLREKSKGYEFAGVQLKWEKQYIGDGDHGSNIKMSLEPHNSAGSGTFTGSTLVNSDADFGVSWGSYMNLYNDKKETAVFNAIVKTHDWADYSNPINFFEIKPILRPFNLILVDDGAEFLDSSGNMVTDKSKAYTELNVSGTGTIAYMGNTVDLIPKSDVANGVRSGSDALVDIKQVQILDKNNNVKGTIDLEGNSDKRTFIFDLDFINKYTENGTIEYKTNSSHVNTFGGSANGLYGELRIRPVYAYKNVEVTVDLKSSNIYDTNSVTDYSKQAKGFLFINGKNVSSEIYAKNKREFTYTYHLGDVVKTTVKMNDGVVKHQAAGIKVEEPAESKESLFKYMSSNGYSADIDSNGCLSKQSECTISPVFVEKNNSVVVRVHKDDLFLFDTSYGVLNGITNSSLEDDYYSVILDEQVDYNQIYTLNIKMNSTINYPTWYVGNQIGMKYTGDTFYHRGASDIADNIITLGYEGMRSQVYYETVKRKYFFGLYSRDEIVSRYIKYNDWHTVSGTLQSDTFYINSSMKDYKKVPCEGAVICIGSGSAIADENGQFETTPFRARAGRKIRYIVEYNGKKYLEETTLGTNSTSKTITVDEVKNGEIVSVKKTVDLNTSQLNKNNIESTCEVLNSQNFSLGVTSDVSDGMKNNFIYIDKAGKVTLTGKMRNDGVEYENSVYNTSTGKFENNTLIEKITGLTFVVYNPDNEMTGEYPATYNSSTGVFTATIDNIALIQAGSQIYVRAKTDRVTSENIDEKGNVVGQSVMTYAEVNTGYSFFYSSTKYEAPTFAKVEPVGDMGLGELTLVGDIGVEFEFPNLGIGVEINEDGTRLTIGEPEAFDSTKKNNDINNAIKEAMGGGSSSEIGPIEVGLKFGMYFQFDKEGYLAAIGGGIGVELEVEASVTFVVPVVMLPVFFGIKAGGGIELQLEKSLENSDINKDKALSDGSVLNNTTDDDVKKEGKLAANVQAFVGVGLAGILEARGTFTIGLEGKLATPLEEGITNEWGFQMSFKLGAEFTAVIFTVKFEETLADINFGSYEEEALKNKARAITSGEFVVRKADTDNDSVWLPDGVKSNMAVRNSDGLSSTLPGTPELLAGFSETNSYTLVSDGYEYADVQLIKLSDGSIFMAYLDNDLSRGELERVVLKYAVYKDGVWSEPVVIHNDGTADYQPSICEMDNSRVMISWLSSDPSVEKSGDAENYLSSLEVYTAVVDYDAKTPVSEITRLTTDEYYDYLPVSVYDDTTGDRAVYFVKTASDGTAAEMVNTYANDCVIVYMLWSDPENDGEGRWLFDYYYDEEAVSEEDKQYLIESWHGQRFLSSPIPELGIDVPNISDFTATTYNGLAVYAYTIDQDSSNDTLYDRELFIQFYDFTTHTTYMPVRLSNDEVSDTMPQLVRVGEGEEAYTALFWYRDENEVVYVDVTHLIREGVDENGNILDEYMSTSTETSEYSNELSRIYSHVSIKPNDNEGNRTMSDFKAIVDNGNVYIVWTQAPVEEEELCREVYAAALITSYDEETETYIRSWSNPYRLTYYGKFTDQPAVAVDTNGNMMVVYNKYMQALVEEGLETSDFNLCASYMQPCGAVDVENITLSDKTPVEGETVEINFEAVNNGLTYAEGYTIKVYAEKDGKSTLITTIENDTRMIPAGINMHTVEWTAPADAEGYVIKTDAFEKGGNWTNHSYAESEAFIKRAEYDVSNIVVSQEGNEFVVNYDITNTGNAEAASDDKFVMELVGPYNDTFNCTEEECIFAEVPMSAIAAGETVSFSEKLNVPSHVFEKYGYVNCSGSVYDKDNNLLTDGVEVRVKVEEPMNIMLNDEEYPESITMTVGDTLNFNVSCTPETMSNNLDVEIGTDENNIISLDGTKITAYEAGTATLHASSLGYGSGLPDITITVLELPEYSVREVDEGVIITEYNKLISDRIEIPEEIDGKKVVGIDDFAFAYTTEDLVIEVPDTLMSKYIGSEAFMTYAVVNEQIIEVSGGETVNDVLRYWANDIGGMNYTDEQIAEAVAKALSHIDNYESYPMPVLIMEVLKNADELGFSQANLDKLDFALSLMAYDKVKLEGSEGTDTQAYAAGKINLEYNIAGENLIGDVTLDGKVDLYDAIAIAKYMIGAMELSDEALANGDLTDDNVVNLYDVIEVAKMLIN